MQEYNKELSNDDSINLKDVLSYYARYWKWFLLSLILCLVIAKVYLRYSIPFYKSTATLLIKDENSGGLSSEMSAFKELDLFGNSSRNVDDEIEILKSRNLVEKTIRLGEFNIKYIQEGRIKSSDAYGKNAIKIKFNSLDTTFTKRDTLVSVEILSDNNFELFDANKKSKGKFNFNQKIASSKLGDFYILKIN